MLSPYCEYSPTKNPMLHKDFDNQEYTMPSQSVRQNCNPVFLGNRNFIEDKNGSRPLDRLTGKVTILHSLSLRSQGNTKQQTTLSTAFLSLSSDLYTNICRMGVPTQQMYSHGAAGRCTYSRGSPDVSLHTAADPALWTSLCLSRQPSNMNFLTVQTWLSSSMFKRNPLCQFYHIH